MTERRAALDRTTVAVAARDLWASGRVTTRPSEHDRRATRIEIADEGLALLTSVQDQVVTGYANTTSGPPPRRRAQARGRARSTCRPSGRR